MEGRGKTTGADQAAAPDVLIRQADQSQVRTTTIPARRDWRSNEPWPAGVLPEISKHGLNVCSFPEQAGVCPDSSVADRPQLKQGDS